MIFVSLPYSHPDPDVVTSRYALACLYSAKLLRLGHVVQSPIVTGHAIIQVTNLPGDFNFWKNYCLTVLSACEEMHVLKLDGWENSTGILAELMFAKERGIPVEYIERDDI